MSTHPRRVALLLAITLSGACGLTWEVLWQHYAALALGLSSVGTAMTLAALMGGLGLGGALASQLAWRGGLTRPMLAYAAAELVIGLGGVLSPLGFAATARLDSYLYASSPAMAMATRALATGLVLLPPSMAMGATLPILAPRAAALGMDLAVVYALNTLGAVLGVLGATFFVLPSLGIAMTTAWTAMLNILVAAWALVQWQRDEPSAVEPTQAWPAVGTIVLAASSGLAIFMLEVSWFRSMRAAFQSSTETFAVLLAAFLVCLALGAWMAPRAAAMLPNPLGWLPPLAALAVLTVTPSVDRVDHMIVGGAATMAGIVDRLLGVLSIVLVPVTLLGMIFPLLLGKHGSTTSAGRLYAINTIGAVVGALCAGFVLLPAIGATHTSWLAAALITLGGLAMSPGRLQLAVAIASLVVGGLGASLGTHDAASARVQGHYAENFSQLLHVDEGPDSTLWIAEDAQTHNRALIIDGFQATSEGVNTEYMRWMGHLPALAATRLDRALVICFGTGQTADALWQQHPLRLDVVDVSRAVLDAAGYFHSNHGVLQRDNVHVAVMDGRAFLRRKSSARFDVVTLEPMPPNFAGVNNLYSKEFYELVASRLATGGMVAQWVPYHLVSSEHMRSIVAAFTSVFPYTRLWQQSAEKTGILLGGKRPWSLHASAFPLPASASEIEERFVLNRRQLKFLVNGATAVTDDNQLLSYGSGRLTRSARRAAHWSSDLAEKNQALVRQASRTID